MYKSILYLFFMLLFASCATHNGYLSSNAVLADANFRVVGLAVGESESVKVLGFGGLKENALVLAAKKDLYKNTTLKAGQALTNITVDFKREFYVFFSRTRVVLTGEIVDFNAAATQGQNYYDIRERKGLQVGEAAYVASQDTYIKAQIVALELNRVAFKPDGSKPEQQIAFCDYKHAFGIKGEFSYLSTRYSVGDSIKIAYVNSGNSPEVSTSSTLHGVIVGVSATNALVLDKSAKFVVIAVD